jgi:hypothetical protein
VCSFAVVFSHDTILPRTAPARPGFVVRICIPPGPPFSVPVSDTCRS